MTSPRLSGLGIVLGSGVAVFGTSLYVVGANTADYVQINPVGASNTGSTGRTHGETTVTTPARNPMPIRMSTRESSTLSRSDSLRLDYGRRGRTVRSEPSWIGNL